LGFIGMMLNSNSRHDDDLTRNKNTPMSGKAIAAKKVQTIAPSVAAINELGI
jgi:hypothetical protein